MNSQSLYLEIIRDLEEAIEKNQELKKESKGDRFHFIVGKIKALEQTRDHIKKKYHADVFRELYPRSFMVGFSLNMKEFQKGIQEAAQILSENRLRRNMMGRVRLFLVCLVREYRKNRIPEKDPRCPKCKSLNVVFDGVYGYFCDDCWWNGDNPEFYQKDRRYAMEKAWGAAKETAFKKKKSVVNLSVGPFSMGYSVAGDPGPDGMNPDLEIMDEAKDDNGGGEDVGNDK